MHLQGNRAGALRSLRKALELDAGLSTDVYASNLIREITGLAASDALSRLTDKSTSEDLVREARKTQRNSRQSQRQGGWLAVLGGLVVVVMIAGFWIVRSGMFSQPRIQTSSLGGYEYHVSVPPGATPESGWPVVLAFHGYGGNGGHMLPLAEIFNEAGAIFVAPSLGEYRPNPGNGPLEPVAGMLVELGRQYPLQTRGAILLGHSQGGSFAYRFSVYYPTLVAGVVTAGAPEYDAIYPTRNIPYIFTWGELDGLQEFVLPMVYPIQNRGWNVRTAVVPGVGHELSRYAVDQALSLLQGP